MLFTRQTQGKSSYGESNYANEKLLGCSIVTKIHHAFFLHHIYIVIQKRNAAYDAQPNTGTDSRNH